MRPSILTRSGKTSGRMCSTSIWARRRFTSPSVGGGVAQPQLADHAAADAQGLAVGMGQPGVGEVEVAGHSGAAEVDTPLGAQAHGAQIVADGQVLGVQRGAARGVEFAVVGCSPGR
ncbi:hypothetical protein ACH4TX_09600 [Streptomyces sp. NPDC021098]|uniref:hypothetical protein n=1 Tax=unclassified Streptomyces TaxID=2593676 RepID=UPI00378DC9A8